MSLGVLNNLSALYAENNLNNSNNSLNTVLQQLSSGSKINSGADDAAGLSLVDGLQANQMALTQSVTNATEGVGLLQVADGALSQVTSLLNRAVTLATEASNGTLNSSQDTAANQEYQSILSEISNIGTTTTYNDAAVFNKSTDIYTGDSSTTGSSIDDLNIRTLSSSNVGDSGGVMAYSGGSNSVFVNLSSSTVNAQATDDLNTNGTTSINVNYLVKGSNGQESTATTSITVGTGTSYSNTANGLISAINNSGLGLSANFSTQSQAGVAGGGTETGIQISGGVVSVGVDPNAVSTSGTLSLSGSSASSLLTQGQTISIQSGTQTALSVVVGPTTKTLADLATAINDASAASNATTGTKVAATVVTNSAGVQSLSLTNANDSEGQLQVTTSQSNYTPALTATNVTSGDNPVSLSFTSTHTGAATVAGDFATATLGVASITNAAAAPLSGDLVLSNGSSGSITINMNQSGANVAASNATTINLSTANSNLTGLAAALNGTSGVAAYSSAVTALGVSAALTSNGLSLTSNTDDTTIAGVSTGLTATPSLTLSDAVNGAAASPATTATTTLAMVNGGSAAAVGYNNGDTLTTGSSIVITNGSTDSPATPITFVVGASTGAAHTYYTGGGNNTVSDLLGIIGAGAGAAAAGIASATVVNHQIVLTASSTGTTLNATSSLVDNTPTVAASAASAVGVSTNSIGGQATLLTGTTAAGGDTLTGSVVISNGLGTTDTFTMGAGGGDVGTTLTSLMDAINTAGSTAGLDITATLNSASGGLNLNPTAGSYGTSISIGADNLGDSYATEFTNPASGSSDLGAQYEGGILNLANGGNLSNVDAGAGALTGSIVIDNVVGAHKVSDTFTMQSGSGDANVGNQWTLSTASSNLAGLEAAINGTGAFAGTGAGNDGTAADDLDVVASTDTASGGIFIQSATETDTDLSVGAPAGSGLGNGSTASLTDVGTLTGSNGTAGTVQSDANVVFSNTANANNANDVVSGSIVLSNTGYNSGNAITFVMGAGTATNSGAGVSSGAGATFTLTNDTLGDLAAAIENSSLGLTASAGASGLSVTSAVDSSTISTAGSLLKDNYGASVNASAGASFTPATSASAILGADQAVGATDALSGNIVLNNGGSNYTFNMASSNAGSTATDINTSGTTIQDLANSISSSALGVNATVVNGALQLQASGTDTSITVVGTPTLKDSATEALVSTATGTAGTPGSASTATVSLAGDLTSESSTSGYAVTGAIALTGTGGTETFTMGATANGGTTLESLATAITTSDIGISADVVGTGLSLTMTSDVNTSISVGVNSLNDTLGNAPASMTLGSFQSNTDTLSAGAISFTVGSSPEVISTTANETVSSLVNQINDGGTDPYGVAASWNSGTDQVVLTSNTYGTAGNFSATSSNVTDTTTGQNVSYTANAAYNVGISNSTGANALYDSSTQSAPTSAYTNFVGNTSSGSGVATISYSDGAGVSLSASDLSDQADAESALTNLNSAITAVAAQDGYIGAQINTLNAVSQVLSTQQENVESAQNAVQATDYASATSNMSKYEILSQTGIAALAQANSVQQEVTKLLQ